MIRILARKWGKKIVDVTGTWWRTPIEGIQIQCLTHLPAPSFKIDPPNYKIQFAFGDLG